MKRTLLLVGAILAAGAVVPMPAGAETAAVLEPQIVERTSEPTTGDIAEVVVLCPLGTKLYSAGGRLNGQSGQAVLHRVQPLPNLSGVVVGARLRTAGPAWSVTGYAICAAGNPVLQPSAGIGSIVHKQSTAACVMGTVTGVGNQLGNATSEVALMRLIPDPGPNTATAAASGPDLPGVWSIQASAICAGGINGAMLKTVKVGPDTQSPKTANVSCGGMKLIGVGGAVVDNPNQPGALTELQPKSDGSVRAMGTSGASPWSMVAYAICV